MAQRIKTIPTRVDLERDIDTAFTGWADDEGRSKRRHISILVRKLTMLRKTNPEGLAALGLIDLGAVQHAAG